MDPIETTQTPETDAEPDNAQAEADFASGFGPPDAPTGDLPPVADAPEAQPTPEPTPTAAPTLDQAQIAKILAAAAEIDTMKGTLERSFGTAFGKIGGIERTLKTLQEATPSGQALTVSADDFEEMKADFPELAAMHVKGLNRALSKLKGTGTPAVDPVQFTEQVSQQMTQRLQALEEKSALQVCDLTMPGWRTEVNTPEFTAWFAAQQLQDTWDPVQIQHHLTTFKASRAKPKAPAGNPRRDILAAAVTPRSAGGPVPTATSDEEQFQAGFAGR